MTTPEAAASAAQRNFLAVSALLFAVSATTTVVWCISMAGMRGMEMPGGWTMSMAWMRRSGQTWPGVAAAFLGMWTVMMVAMMLPSLVPALARYREAAGDGRHARLGWQTLLMALGYFSVWTIVGLAAFPLGAALSALEMQSPAVARAVPLTVGAFVLVAGAWQFSAWKTKQLACCRSAPAGGGRLPANVGIAWRQGLRLGVHCVYCCGGLVAILLVIGVMNLWVMVLVMAAISLERIASHGERVARAIGVVTIAAGVLLILRAT